MDTIAPERPVVVGVDGSKEADAALRWAADEAQRRRRRLRVVCAVDLTLAAGRYPELTVPARRSAQDVLDVARARVHEWTPEVHVDMAADDGRASTVLLGQTPHAELLVLGSRGRGGFASMLLGSTALQVAMHAQCPVVVLRAGVEGSPTGSSGGRVVVGTDGSRQSAAAVSLAFEEADLRGVGVTAVRTWLGPELDVEAPPAYEWEQEEKNEQARLAEDLRIWRSRFPHVDLVEKVVRGGPAPTLIAESAGATLLAVGSHGRNGFRGLVLGSVSHAVLHHARCPVAVVRP
jgi:nucleotide-binding universal stress UspA family protein